MSLIISRKAAENPQRGFKIIAMGKTSKEVVTHGKCEKNSNPEAGSISSTARLK